MKARKIVVLMAVGLAYGCGGGDSSSPIGSQDGGSDGTVPDGGSTLPDGGGDDGGTAGDANDGAALLMDAATGDAGDAASSTDAPSDGPSFDGNLTCTGTNTACTFGTDAGLAASGLCASSACGPCATTTDDALCQAAYGG